MVNQNLVNYFKGGVKRRISIEELKKRLATEGWPTAEIESSYAAAFPKGAFPMQNKKIPLKQQALQKINNIANPHVAPKVAAPLAVQPGQRQPVAQPVQPGQVQTAKPLVQAAKPAAKQENLPVEVPAEPAKQNPKEMKMEKGKRPAMVSIIAIYHWIIAAGIAGSFTWQYLSNKDFLNSFFSIYFSGGTGPAQIIFIVGVALAAISILISIFAGIGLWKGKNGWRIFALIFGIIFFLLGAVSLATQVTIYAAAYVAVDLFIVIALFTKKVKAFFKNKKEPSLAPAAPQKQKPEEQKQPAAS